jgi:hypothetical protein
MQGIFRLSVLFSLCLLLGLAHQASAEALKATLKLLTPLSTKQSHLGDSFTAEVTEDVYRGLDLIVPKGSLVNGQIETLESSKAMGRSAMMVLGLDHIIRPNGELTPLDIKFDPLQTVVHGNIRTKSTLNERLDESFNQGGLVFDAWKARGNQFESRAGRWLGKPFANVSGALNGMGTVTSNAAKALFSKGDTIQLSPGDTFVLDFSSVPLSPFIH